MQVFDFKLFNLTFEVFQLISRAAGQTGQTACQGGMRRSRMTTDC